MNQDFNYQPQNNDFSYQQNTFNPAPTPKGHAKGYAVTSLILGIAAIFFCCLCCCFYYPAIILAIVSIVMAFLAKRDNGGKMPGMAIAGLILAIIGILLFIAIFAIETTLSSMTTEELAAMLDPLFEDAYGMSFEEYMNSQGIDLGDLQ